MLVKTPLYDRLFLSVDWKSASLTRKVEDEVQGMKARVRRAKQKRTAEQLANELRIQVDRERLKEDKKKKNKARCDDEQAKDETHMDVGHSQDSHVDGFQLTGYQNGGAAGQGQGRRLGTGAGATPFLGPTSPPPPPPAVLSHAATAPEQQPTRDIEALGDPSRRRGRRPQFLGPPAMISDAAQTTPGLLERARSRLSVLGPDGSAGSAGMA